MPRLSKVKHGCNCLHEDTSTASPNPSDVCCDDIPESFCTYVMLVECHHNQLRTQRLPGVVLFPCDVLRKECITGCLWSLWTRREVRDDEQIASGPGFCDASAKNGIVRINDANRVQPYCTWTDLVAFGEVDSNGVDDWESFTYLHHRLWTLEPDGYGGALLTLVTDDAIVGQEGLQAVYRCASWDWASKATFIRESVDPGLRLATLQCTICIAPLDAEPLNPCYNPDHKCTCCDPGWDEGVLFVTINGCGLYAGSGGVQVVRNAELPCGVSDPGGACGYFWGSTGTGLGLLTWCDGVSWHVEAFCFESPCWVSQGEAEVTSQECLCPGMALTFTLPDLDCCGNPCDSCSPPSTLYADLTSSCSGWSGTVTLTESAGVWQGSAGAPAQVVDVQLRCIDGDWILTIEAANASCGLDNAIADSWTCTPAFEASFTVPLSSDCCPPSGGTITVEVYE